MRLYVSVWSTATRSDRPKILSEINLLLAKCLFSQNASSFKTRFEIQFVDWDVIFTKQINNPFLSRIPVLAKKLIGQNKLSLMSFFPIGAML